MSILCFITLTNVLLFARSKTHFEDIQVLKQIENSLDPKSITPGSCISSWNFTYDPCDSLSGERFTCGFTCSSPLNGLSRITEIALDQAGYTGPILASTEWRKSPFLETLDLFDNFFTGPIPSSLSNMTRLRRLGFSRNLFSGEIPRSIETLSSLEYLLLDDNLFQGQIPQLFKGLPGLKRIQIQSNKLSGEFPDPSPARNLTLIDASNNWIWGKFPKILPPRLVQISMRNNKMNGTIEINNVGFLQVLDLSHNDLSGTIPSTLFMNPWLQQINLSFNRFESIEIPRMGNAVKSGLIAIDLNHNRLRGLLPNFMSEIPNLSVLSMESNRLTGILPIMYAMKAAGEISGVVPFSRLMLGGNYLFGTVPSQMMRVKESDVKVSLVDNCLYRCPVRLFFCRGGEQKAFEACRSLGPMIPNGI